MWFIVRPIKRWMESITATATEINEQCDLSASGAVTKTLRVPITAAPDGTEQDSGVDLPLKSVVLGYYVDVTAAEVTGATKTMDIGLLSTEVGGDADGFGVGIDCSAVGIQKPTLLNTGQTLGALLAVDESGGGVLVPEGHVCNGTAVSVSYTAGSVGDWVEFRGDIYFVLLEAA